MKNDFDPNKPAVPIAYPRLLLDMMLERGFSRQEVLADSNIDANLFDKPEHRITPAQFLFLVLRCFYLSKDPSLGYEMGLRTPVTSHGFLGYGVMSCANQLRFPKAFLKQPLIMADPVAAKLAAEQCERELALFDSSDDISTQVRAMLHHQQGYYPQLEQVAERLFMSSRTLKRRLQQAGLGFQQLLDEARKRDAIKLLQNTSLTIEQIAQRLGYTDPANFSRAFKKWTGENPSAYRQVN